MDKTYYVVMINKEDVGNKEVWDFLKGHDIYLCDEEWRDMSWTADFEKARRFKSPEEINDFFKSLNLKAELMSDNLYYRPTGLHIASGAEKNIGRMNIRKITVSEETVSSFLETDFYDFSKIKKSQEIIDNLKRL